MNSGVRIPVSRKSRLANDAGQTLVEYALILLLIAVVVILLIIGVGRTTNNTYSTINSEVSRAVGT